MSHKHAAGFTTVELLISMSVLAVLLVLVAFTSIQLGKMFYKGVTSSRTQEAVRRVSSELSRNVGYTSSKPNNPPTIAGKAEALCVGSVRYSYVFNQQVAGTNHALWRDSVSSGSTCTQLALTDMQNACPTPNPNPPNNCLGSELLDNGMRLLAFSSSSSDTSYWTMHLKVAFGDDAVFDGSGNCRSSNQGGQFCSISELTFGVYRRL